MSDITPEEKVSEPRPQTVSEAAVAEPHATTVTRSVAIRRVLIVAIVAVVLSALYRRELGQAVRRWIASYHAGAASKQLLSQEAGPALESVDHALRWLPDDPALIYLRGQIHVRAQNLDAALADFTRLTDELAPNFTHAYRQRAAVHQQMGEWDQALADLDHAVQLTPEGSWELINHLNNRAYVRALKGEQLDQATADVERAIELYTERARQIDEKPTVPAAFVDTLGYIRFRLGQWELARSDIQRALTLLEDERAKDLQRIVAQNEQTGPLIRRYDRVRGEIVHHRGLILHALGLEDEAEDDLKLAVKLGYDPPQTPD